MKSDIYKIGRNLGLDKKDIGSILSSRPTTKDRERSSSPVELYKSGTMYGTLSIEDF